LNTQKIKKFSDVTIAIKLGSKNKSQYKEKNVCPTIWMKGKCKLRRNLVEVK